MFQFVMIISSFFPNHLWKWFLSDLVAKKLKFRQTICGRVFKICAWNSLNDPWTFSVSLVQTGFQGDAQASMTDWLRNRPIKSETDPNYFSTGHIYLRFDILQWFIKFALGWFPNYCSTNHISEFIDQSKRAKSLETGLSVDACERITSRTSSALNLFLNLRDFVTSQTILKNIPDACQFSIRRKFRLSISSNS